MRLNVFEDGRKIAEKGEVRFDFSSKEKIHFKVRSQSDPEKEYQVDVGRKWNAVNCDCHHGRKSKTLFDKDTGGICKHMVAVIRYISENRGALENLVEDAETPRSGSP